MARGPGVNKWMKIASALHFGALEHHCIFDTTQDVINYLYSYQEPPGGAERVNREIREFYYHPDKLKCPFPLGELFDVGEADRCLLCRKIALDEQGKFKYKPDPGAAAVCLPPEREPRELVRLRHLAVIHTPYFLMLFLELVKNKQHVLHEHPDEAFDIAAHVYDVLKEDQAGHFTQKRGFPFLQEWWEFQERTSLLLGLSIPYYLEMQNGSCRWTPKLGNFESRKPEPLYSFVSDKCLCHDVWPHEVAEYGRYADLSPRVETLKRGHASTFSVRILMPKLHNEAILGSLVTSWYARGKQMCGTNPVECSSLLAPRLDCLVLEDVCHPQAVMMHIVVTLKSDWQSLTTWIASARNGELVSDTKKVFIGVLGALRDMCLANNRPPSELYAEANSLANLFFVHSETKEVLSLLPYVSINRLHRSSNCPKDEDSFRLACANLALIILCSRGDHTPTTYLDKTLMRQWRASEVGSVHLSDEELSHLNLVMEKTDRWPEVGAQIWNSLQFCRSGLTDPSAWSALNPHECGSRDMSRVDTLDVWLGETSRTPYALKNKLLAMKFNEPLRVSIIEVLNDVEIYRIRGEECKSKITPWPEKHMGLVNAVTIYQSAPRYPSIPSSMNVQSDAWGGSDPRSRKAAKRVSKIDCFSEVASKKSHKNAAGGALEYISEPVGSLKGHTSPSLSKGSTEHYSEKMRSNGQVDGQFNPETNAKIYTNQEVAIDRNYEVLTEVHLTADCESFAGYEPSQYNHVDPFVEKEHTSDCWAVEPNDESLFEINYTDDMETLERLIRENDELLLLESDETGKCEDSACGQSSSGDPDLQQSQCIPIEQHEERQCPLPNLVEPAAGCPWLEHILGESESNRVEIREQQLEEHQRPAVCFKDHLLGGQSECHLGHISITSIPAPTNSAHYGPLLNWGAGSKEGREATPQEQAFLNRNPRWKSNGFNPTMLKEIQCTEYKMMIYKTQTKRVNGRNAIVLQTKPRFDPISSPCENLDEPAGTPSQLSTNVTMSTVGRGQTLSRKFNEKLGIESCKSNGFKILYCPEELKGYVKQIAQKTLNCRETPQTYCTLDLSQMPELGFQHVALEVNDFPVGNHDKPLIKIQSSQAMHLGTVCTVQGASGLLCARVFAKTCKILEDILDMHTRLQLNSFVPRVFTLQLMKVPFANESAVGVFVGESPGEWNLGCPQGMASVSRKDKFVLAHHVLKCLLRAQMLTLSVLGFPLRCIQPARIWKHDGGFRLDLASCLVDTIQKWFMSNKSGTRDLIGHGVAAVKDTLSKLELLDVVPRELAAMLDNTFDCSESDVFHRIYAVLNNETFYPNSDLHVTVDSCGQYKKITVDTNVGPVEPFGPFRVQIHNQCFKWNKAIIVEPLTRGRQELAQIAITDTGGLTRNPSHARHERTLEDADACSTKSAGEPGMQEGHAD